MSTKLAVAERTNELLYARVEALETALRTLIDGRRQMALEQMAADRVLRDPSAVHIGHRAAAEVADALAVAHE